MAIKRKNSNKEWIIDQNAIETSIIDVEGNFESDNVEGALRELSQKVKRGQDLTALEAKIESNRQGILSNAERLATAEEDIEWLKVNGGGGGGGGGTAVPTITSTFKDATVEKGQDVDIPIFFSSPNICAAPVLLPEPGGPAKLSTKGVFIFILLYNFNIISIFI